MSTAKKKRAQEPDALCEFENDKFNIQYDPQKMEDLQTEWQETNAKIKLLIEGNIVQTDDVIEELKTSFIRMFNFWRDRMRMLHDELHHGDDGKKISGMTVRTIGGYTNIDFLALMVMECVRSFDEKATNVFSDKYDHVVDELQNSYALSLTDYLGDIKEMTDAETGDRVILMYGYVGESNDKNYVPVGFAWFKIYTTEAMQRTMTVFSKAPQVVCDAVMDLDFHENKLGQIKLLCSYARRNGVCITGLSAKWLIDTVVLVARQKGCGNVILTPANDSLQKVYRKWMCKDSCELDLITLAYIQFTVYRPNSIETEYNFGGGPKFMWLHTHNYSLLMHGIPTAPRLACNYCLRRFREMDY